MAKGKKSGMGVSILGFIFFVFGLIFLLIGQAAIGLPFFGTGVVFILIGVAAARKPPPPNGSTGR